MDFKPCDDEPLSDEYLATQVRLWSEGLAGTYADDPIRATILHEISDLSWRAGALLTEMIPTLVRWPANDDKKIEDALCYALCNLAPSSMSPLLTMLKSEWRFLRLRAAYTFGLIGENLGDRRLQVVDSLVACLDDESEAVRQESARALGLTRDSRPSTVGRLSAMARNDTSPNRAAALYAIGNIARGISEGYDTQVDIPSDEIMKLVLAALGDNDEDIRYSACHALEALNLPTAEHLARIFAILQTDVSANVRRRAAIQLPNIAKRCDLSASAETLALLLDDEDEIVLPVCEAIGTIGPRAMIAIPVLHLLMNSKNDYISLKAIQALWCVEHRADTLLPSLDRLFDGHGESVCDIVCALGPAAQALLPKLVAALAQSEDWDLQWAAADAIGSIASSDPATLQSLKVALTHNSSVVRSAAANALGNVGAPASSVLIEMLSDDRCSDKVYEYVAHALAKIGSAAVDAAPLLRMKFQSGDAGLRRWSAIALAKITSDASAVPELLNMLDDEDQADNWALACDALAAVGPAAAIAHSRLQTVALIPIEELQSAAIAAIESINRQPS